MTQVRRSGTSPARLGLGLASVALAALLLVGFKAPQEGVIARVAAGGGTGGTTGGASGASTGGTGTTGTGTSGTGASGGTSGTTTYDGSVVNTRYGPVEVEITVSNGKILSATAIALPSGGRSGAISRYVAPILSSEAVAAQSSNIDLVSGATYTSDAYAQSLQSALDQAGI